MEPGHKLAQYQITKRIGAGGMGEVYQARDTNLDRNVAIKVLPGNVAENPVQLTRLEREAKAIAALSHPNILAVYDFGTEDGTAFVVTELLEGETLRDRMAHGALASRKVTEFGRQIARGLAAAHDKGIVHRDLKPENVFVSGEGRVKILDFGLATASGDTTEPDTDASVDLDTRTRVTEPGTVLGTIDYMSPEQVRGEATDNRSDLFSFGSVLYEMITGSRPFHRDTKAETMTAILKEEPNELASLDTSVAPALAAIVRRCLEKHPGERFHSAHDLAFSLEALSGSTVSTGTAAALKDVSAPRRRPGAAIMAGLVIAGLAIGATATWLLRPTPEADTIATYTRLSSRRGTVTNARFTGGDDTAVYGATWAGGPIRLYPATMGSRTSDPLNIENADLLSIASTGELALLLDQRNTLGWEIQGTLAVAQPGGTAPRPLLENVQVADWAPDGRTLAVSHEVDGVVRLEYPIGTVLYESSGWIKDIRVNPDAERVLIVDCPARGDNRSFVKIVHGDGQVEDMGRGGDHGAVWAPDGESVWMSNGNRVSRQRPGEESVVMVGTPVSVKILDVAPSGRVLAAIGTVRREMVVRAPGTDEERDFSWLDWTTPSLLSNDGQLAVFEEGNDFSDGGYGVYLRDTGGSPPLLLGYGSALALSPDARWLAMVKRPFADDSELQLVPTGPGVSRTVDIGGLRLTTGQGTWLALSDGESLVAPARLDDGPLRLFHVPLEGSTAPRAITPADFRLAPNGHIVSPDGRRIVARPSVGTAVEFGIDGDGPRPVAGLLPGDLPLKFDRDGLHIFVQARLTVPSPIYRINIDTGERTLWRELAPLDRAGVVNADRVRISDDGSVYTYSIRRILSALTVVDGLN